MAFKMLLPPVLLGSTVDREPRAALRVVSDPLFAVLATDESDRLPPCLCRGVAAIILLYMAPPGVCSWLLARPAREAAVGWVRRDGTC
jgi:hypothetical protein